MKKVITLLQLGISSTFGNNQAIGGCVCKCSVNANKVTFSEKGELIFVNEVFNLESETKDFASYTKLTPTMEELDSSKLKNSTKNSIYLYDLKVGYSPNGYCCFKYNDIIYVIKEDQGRYLLPIAEKENNSFKEKIDWVCIIGSDKGNDNKQHYFLLKKKFEDNKKNALTLDDFISKNKFKSRDEKMKITIIDEEKQKEAESSSNNIITVNSIQINIGAINTINDIKNIQQDVKILNKK